MGGEWEWSSAGFRISAKRGARTFSGVFRKGSDGSILAAAAICGLLQRFDFMVFGHLTCIYRELVGGGCSFWSLAALSSFTSRLAFRSRPCGWRELANAMPGACGSRVNQELGQDYCVSSPHPVSSPAHDRVHELLARNTRPVSTFSRATRNLLPARGVDRVLYGFGSIAGGIVSALFQNRWVEERAIVTRPPDGDPRDSALRLWTSAITLGNRRGADAVHGSGSVGIRART